jgi:beta-lactamase superfamily II metal-dependent hydrolase
MIEIDFLKASETEKSADAITLRFTRPDTGGLAVCVIDAGHQDMGDEVLAHIAQRYGTTYIDLVVSTHPDANHINGLKRVMIGAKVNELFLHLPGSHGYSSPDVKADVADELASLARSQGVTVTEPFAGLQRFGGALTVVGPSAGYYESLLAEAVSPAWAIRAMGYKLAELLKAAQEAARVALFGAPVETLLDDAGGTTPCNNTSVILQLVVDGRRTLFTGDAGVPSLARAADFMDATGLSARPLSVFQAPHHGSRHNLDAHLLDRLFGPPMSADGTRRYNAIISAADRAPKHPSPKVTNALKRRGCFVATTERSHIWYSQNAPFRTGYGPADDQPWLDESQTND